MVREAEMGEGERWGGDRCGRGDRDGKEGRDGGGGQRWGQERGWSVVRKKVPAECQAPLALRPGHGKLVCNPDFREGVLNQK